MSYIVISGPSGVGKTSIVNALCVSDKRFIRSVSYTTRAMRPGERNNIDYGFITKDHFLDMRSRGMFIESAKVSGNFYGTPTPSPKYQYTILTIDPQGMLQIKTKYHDVITFFIAPPSKDALLKRLQSRNQDDNLVIETRMKELDWYMSQQGLYDYVFINDELERVVEQILNTLK